MAALNLVGSPLTSCAPTRASLRFDGFVRRTASIGRRAIGDIDMHPKVKKKKQNNNNRIIYFSGINKSPVLAQQSSSLQMPQVNITEIHTNLDQRVRLAIKCIRVSVVLLMRWAGLDTQHTHAHTHTRTHTHISGFVTLRKYLNWTLHSRPEAERRAAAA